MTEDRKYGLQKVTLTDYPEEVAATLFTTGCNLRCPYCHNAELAAGETPAAFLSLDKIFAYLEKRKTVLTGVCITGGEALLDPNLSLIIDTLHQLGLKVKLDTNGTLPNRLRQSKVDFIAMDIKTSLAKYPLLGAAAPNLASQLKESIHYILHSGIPHEFRTTCMPGLVGEAEIREISRLIQGCDRYALAQFNPQKTLDPKAAEVEPWPFKQLQHFQQIAQSYGLTVLIRGHF